MTDAAVSSAFAPSELVVLFGDRFAPEGGVLVSREEVMTSGTKVNAQRLMEAALSAALLAVHASGAARLEERESKALFGLVTRRRVHLVPGGSPSPFPAHSLEAALVEASAGAPEVWAALAGWIGAESADPAARAIGVVKRGLAERGLLETVSKRALGVFNVSTFALPEATREAATRHPLEPVHALLGGAERSDPELWNRVRKAVDRARVHMTETSND